MGTRLPNYRLFIYGWPIKCDEHGQSYLIFGFKVEDKIVVTDSGAALIGPVQRISYN